MANEDIYNDRMRKQVAHAAFQLANDPHNILPAVLNGMLNMTMAEWLATSADDKERRERLHIKTGVIGEIQQLINNLADEHRAALEAAKTGTDN